MITRIHVLRSDTPDAVIRPRLVTTLKPHHSPVTTSCIDGTGTLLATGAADGGLKVWDLGSGFVTHDFHGQAGVVTATCFFDVSSISKHRQKPPGFRKQPFARNGISAVEGLTLGCRLAGGGQDGKVRIWDLHTKHCLGVLDAHVSVITSLDYCGEENTLVSGSRDKTVLVWGTHDWKLRKTIPVLEVVESCGFLMQGSLIFTGGEQGRVRLWSSSSGKELTQDGPVGGQTDGIIDIRHHETLPFLLSVRADNTLAIHSLAAIKSTGTPLPTPSLPVTRRISGTHDEVIDLAYLGPDRSMLAVATNLEYLRVISTSAGLTKLTDSAPSVAMGAEYFGADVAELRGHTDIILCLDVDWSGHWLVTGAKDNTARLWRIDASNNSFSCHASFLGHAESIGAISLPQAKPSAGSQAHARPLDHPPEFLLTGSQDKTVKRWNTTSVLGSSTMLGRAFYTRKAHEKDINAIDVNGNNSLFATASQDKTVKIWSVEDGEVLGVLRGHRRGVWDVKFSSQAVPSLAAAGGRGLIMTGSGDKTVKIWNVSDCNCLLTLEGHTNTVLKVLWLAPEAQGTRADGRDVLVASAGGDGLVKVWDVRSGETACTLDNHTDRVWALTNHIGAGTLVSGGGDGIITFWQNTTMATRMAAADALTVRVEQDQNLQNFIRSGDYRKALMLALHMNQPGRLLALFRHVLGIETHGQHSLSGNNAVDDVLATLTDGQLHVLLSKIRDWNTSAGTAQIAQRVLRALIRLHSAARFLQLNLTVSEGTDISLRDVLVALSAYTERHYQKTEGLIDESYVLDFALKEMDEVFGDRLDAIDGDLETQMED